MTNLTGRFPICKGKKREVFVVQDLNIIGGKSVI